MPVYDYKSNSNLPFRQRFIANCGVLVGGSIFFFAMWRNLFSDFPFWMLITPYSMAIIFLIVGYRAKKKIDSAWHSPVLFLGLLAILINAGFLNGGFRAPVTAGVFILPLFSVASMGKNGRWVGLLGSLFCIFTISLAEQLGFTQPFREMGPSVAPIIYMGICLVAAQIIYAYEKARAENDEALFRLSEQLVGSARLSSLGQMASGVAHEINNPLSVIQGKAAQIRRQVEQGLYDDEKIGQDTFKIEQMVMRIAKIIQGLRTLSRDGTADPMNSVKISKVIHESIEMCREKFKNNHIELFVELESKQHVKCRESQISQVILHFLTNSFDAVEHLPERWVRISARDTEAGVEVRVVDSGLGIPQSIADRMLEPFFTTKPLGKGTGIGLSICKGIVEHHGGAIHYDRKSKNTCFVVILPPANEKTRDKVDSMTA
jgi:signal transduction histidine kinase